MEKPTKIDVSTLTHVPETMLIPLYFKAKETKENGMIRDEKAVEIVNKIDYDFSRMETDRRTQMGVASRTLIFDEIVKELITALPQKPVIVNLGAGLDTRQVRFPDLKWYQLDLPVSIAMRKQFFNEPETINIEKSILDFSWIQDITERKNVLFIAEGLFMYFTEEEVRSVVQQIADHFTDSFLALNTMQAGGTNKKHPSVKTETAPLKWGIRSIKDILKWNTGFTVAKIYYPIDHIKMPWYWKLMLRLFPSVRNGYIIALLKK